MIALCACGKPVHAKGRCYLCWKRKYFAEHPDKAEEFRVKRNAYRRQQWAEQRPERERQPKEHLNPLQIFLEAFHCTRQELGEYYAVLRLRARESALSKTYNYVCGDNAENPVKRNCSGGSLSGAFVSDGLCSRSQTPPLH